MCRAGRPYQRDTRLVFRSPGLSRGFIAATTVAGHPRGLGRPTRGDAGRRHPPAGRDPRPRRRGFRNPPGTLAEGPLEETHIDHGGCG